MVLEEKCGEVQEPVCRNSTRHGAHHLIILAFWCEILGLSWIDGAHHKSVFGWAEHTLWGVFGTTNRVFLV